LKAAVCGFPQVAQAELAVLAADGFEVEFRDIEVTMASLLDMAGALAPTCAELAPLLRPFAVLPAGAPLPNFLVVGEVLTARRTIRLNMSLGGSAQVQVDGVRRLLQRIGLDLTARVSPTADSRYAVELLDDKRVPVAVRPVAVPIERIAGLGMGGSHGGVPDTPVPVVRLEQFEHDTPSHQEALDRWLSQRAR
jgi:hypothetical protein